MPAIAAVHAGAGLASPSVVVSLGLLNDRGASGQSKQWLVWDAWLGFSTHTNGRRLPVQTKTVNYGAKRTSA